MKSDSVLNGALVILAICAVILTGMLALREFGHAPSDHRLTSGSTVRDWQSYGKEGEKVGPTNAAITVVEFSDFQCPYCRHASETLEALRAKYSSDLAIVYRHFPLEDLHPFARQAAVAAECAGQQGRFWEFHKLLFTYQDSIGKVPWSWYSTRAGLTSARSFAQCMSTDSTVIRKIVQDIQAGKRLGVWATPTLLVNGIGISGDASFASLDSLMRQTVQGR